MQYVTYIRVSTDKQGQSGLGLEAQQALIKQYISSHTGDIIAEFREVESGRKNKRPELKSALALVKATGARLLIAKLDRLSRNASFIMALRDAQVDFVACDLPDANTLTVGIMALMAQQEAELISTRTKAALKALKARGQKLGSDLVGCHFTDAGRVEAGKAKKENNAEKYGLAMAVALAKDLRNDGRTLTYIAEKLTKYGHKTATGKATWSAKQVSRLLA